MLQRPRPLSRTRIFDDGSHTIDGCQVGLQLVNSLELASEISPLSGNLAVGELWIPNALLDERLHPIGDR